MPELPEVEVTRRGLLPLLRGRRVTGLEYSGKRLRTAVPIDLLRERLPGSVFTDVARRAKYLLFATDREDMMLIHLGMTGKLGISPRNVPPLPHDHLTFHLDNGCEMRFNDARRFGSVAFLPAERKAEELQRFFARTGPEPLGDECTAAYLHRRARGCRQPVKTFIMNGSILAGVGNIYANESLHAASIHPLTPAGRLSRRRWQVLLEAIRNILEHAIECGGSTISDFLDASGSRGYFQINFQVYGREAQPCRHCGAPLQRLVVTGRATYFCPKCQKR